RYSRRALPMAVTIATDSPMSVPLCRNTFMMLIPLSDIDSVCSIPLTVEVSHRSVTVVIIFSMLYGDIPVYVHTQLTIGTSISGKMSTAICLMEIIPNRAMANAITINVWARFSANSTIHIHQCSWVPASAVHLLSGMMTGMPDGGRGASHAPVARHADMCDSAAHAPAPMCSSCCSPERLPLVMLKMRGTKIKVDRVA